MVNVTEPVAFADSPVSVAVSWTDVVGTVGSVATATVEMAGLAGVTTEVSPASPHSPATSSLLSSPT